MAAMKKLGRKKKKSSSQSTASLWAGGVLLVVVVLAILGPDAAEEGGADGSAPIDWSGADNYLASSLDLDRVPEDKRDEFVSITRKAMAAAKDRDEKQAQAHLESAAALAPCIEVDARLGRIYLSQSKTSTGAFNGRLMAKAHRLFKRVYDHVPTSHEHYGSLVLPYANTLHYLEPGERHKNVYAVLDKCKAFEGCQRLRENLDSEYVRVDKDKARLAKMEELGSQAKQQAQTDIDAKPELAVLKGGDDAGAATDKDTTLTDDDLADL